MRKIRKGDQVVIRTGKDRGKRGAVLRLVGDDRVVVEGANRAKKHEKPNPMKGTTGGIVDREMPVHISNVAVFNPSTQKGDRVRIKTLDDGRKVRIFRSNGEMLDA
ncbi:MAG: 50S ribosomal protein L24 [Betaproteobacteria bacterium]|jgi:large subunit ribosomal protein L24|nr:MAG: 50S ribosomal protein L24 [Betaproteobacteria bacterium]